MNVLFPLLGELYLFLDNVESTFFLTANQQTKRIEPVRRRVHSAPNDLGQELLI